MCYGGSVTWDFPHITDDTSTTWEVGTDCLGRQGFLTTLFKVQGHPNGGPGSPSFLKPTDLSS